jgi:hypothetical protein
MTDLSRQLAQLRPTTTAVPAGTSASLLFDVKEASKIDRETIFTIGINGLEELRREDPDLLVFYSDLFQETFASSHHYRDSLTQSQADFIDSELKKILNLLAKHFTHKSCHKILELLIRFYSVHIYCADSVIKAFLPYHCSKIFIRLLKILKIEGTSFEFLQNYRTSGFIIPRKDIVRRCSQDYGCLNSILSLHSLSEHHLRFGTVVVLELLNTVQELKTDMLHSIIPFVSECMSSSEEGRCGSYMILSQIALKQPLSPHYLQAILYDILATATSHVQALKTVILLLKIHTPEKLPNNIMKLFLDAKVIECVIELSSTHNVDTLLKHLLRKLIPNLRKGLDSDLLLNIVRRARLSKESIEFGMQILLREYLNSKKGDEQPMEFVEVIHLTGQRYLKDLVSVFKDVVERACADHPGKESRRRVCTLLALGLNDMPVKIETEPEIRVEYTDVNHRKEKLEQEVEEPMEVEPVIKLKPIAKKSGKLSKELESIQKSLEKPTVLAEPVEEPVSEKSRADDYLKILRGLKRKNMLVSNEKVSISALESVSSLFSEKSVDILKILDLYIFSVLTLITKSSNPKARESALKLLRPCIIHSEEFLSPHLEKLLDTLCKSELNTLSYLALLAKHVPMRCYISMLLPFYSSIPKDNLAYLTKFFSFLKNLFDKLTSEDLGTFNTAILSLFMEAFELPAHFLSVLDDFSKICTGISKAFTAYATSLTDADFKPLFINIFEWCTQRNEDKELNRDKVLLFYTIVITCAEELKSMFISYYSFFWDFSIKFLEDTIETFSNSQKRHRDADELAIRISTSILKSIEYCAIYDKDRYLSDTKYDKLSKVLSDSYTMVGLNDAYKSYTQESLTSTIVSIISSTPDQSVWQAFNYKILLHIRNPSRSVKYASLFTLQKVIDKLGKSYVALLSDIMPLLAEGLGDSDLEVNKLAHRILKQLEVLSGQDLKEYIES